MFVTVGILVELKNLPKSRQSLVILFGEGSSGIIEESIK
jgi:hypothetical protein